MLAVPFCVSSHFVLSHGFPAQNKKRYRTFPRPSPSLRVFSIPSPVGLHANASHPTPDHVTSLNPLVSHAELSEIGERILHACNCYVRMRRRG